MKNKISITGDLGSGKSVVGKILKERLGYPVISTGVIQREIAARMNMTTLELNNYTDSHPEIDEEIDSVFKNLRFDANPCLVDSRLAWFFIPDSFKVYLKVDTWVAAERIMNDKNRKSEAYQTIEEAVADIRARKKSENMRFLREYGADCADYRNFNVVINTAFVTPENVADCIMILFEKYQKGETFPLHWMSEELRIKQERQPERIVPEQKTGELFAVIP
ncbi:MAG: cytidylate kinase family protein [Bacteroidia bacterium]|nr:cytidylate kinase family protein [Bacteroidia bacterium]